MMRIVKRVFIGGAAVLVALIVLFIALIAWPLPDLPSPVNTPGPVAITNATVIEVVEGALNPGQTVLIENGRISAIGPTESTEVPGNASLVDGSGKFLIPGLWDMHAHQGSILSPHLTMPLFVAGGVLNIRDLGGYAPLQQKKEWQRQVNRGDLLGPRVMGQTGSIVAGLSSIEEAEELVEHLVESGADFIKVYNQFLPDHYFSLLDHAKRKGIPVLGHKPRSVRALAAARAGHRSFEHARLFLFECYPGAEDLRERYRARYSGEGSSGGPIETTAMRREMIDNHDPALFDELAEAMVQNGTWYCPTHITRKMDAFADDRNYRHDVRLKLIHFLQRRSWGRDADGMVDRDPTPEGRKAFMDFYLKGLELTGKAHQAGVRILAGTDANDTYCFPGLGLHDELQELVAAGLSPLDALRAATRNPAEYFGLLEDHGSLEAGKVADMVLLDADPLTDITNTTEIHAVIYGGNVYSRADLDDLLASVEVSASSWRIGAQLVYNALMN